MAFILGLVSISPRQFWKDHEHEFPTLARIARDIFSIPATGAGVERLFNSARDICHYRRGRLNANTIQDLMMFTCATRFEMEEEQIAFIQSLSIHEEGETDDLFTETEDIEPISDTEEGEEVLRSIRGGKRRMSLLSNHSDQNDDVLIPLPTMTGSQIRASGRVKKRPRVLEGYEVG